MPDNNATYNINFLSNGDEVFAKINAGLEKIRESIGKVTKSFDDCFKSLLSTGAQSSSAKLFQIQKALEQVGTAAKTTGSSFRETTAQIQLLDNAAKKGSEGGMALHNVLTSLSGAGNTSKSATQGLDTTEKDWKDSISQTVQAFSPYLDNIRSAITLFNDLTDFTDNASRAFKAFREHIWQKVFATNADIGKTKTITTAIKASIEAIKTSTTALKTNIRFLQQDIFQKIQAGLKAAWLSAQLEVVNLQMFAGAILSRVQASGIQKVAIAFGEATLGATSFQIALDALGIGLIVAAIAGLILGFKYLYENCGKFREILGYIKGAGQAVFHNIGVFVQRLWNLIIKPIAGFIFNIFKNIFLGIWEIVKTVFSAISDIFSSIWNSVIKPIGQFIYSLYSKVFTRILNTMKKVFTPLLNFARKIWKSIKNTFAPLANWIKKTIITPISNIFSNAWKWVTDLVDKIKNKITNLVNTIKNKLSGLLNPIKTIWNKLFSSDGMINVNDAGKREAKKERAKFDKEQQQKKKENQNKINSSSVGGSILKLPKWRMAVIPTGNELNPMPIGEAVGRTSKAQIGGSDFEKDSNSKRIANLNITKLVENINIYNQNGTTLSKDSLVQSIKEVLLAATTDYTHYVDSNLA